MTSVLGFSKLTRWLREFDFPSFLDQRENQRHYYSATDKLKLDPFHLVFSRHITFKILLLSTFSLPWSMPFYSLMAINLFRAESLNQIKIRLCSNLTFSQSHNSRFVYDHVGSSSQTNHTLIDAKSYNNTEWFKYLMTLKVLLFRTDWRIYWTLKHTQKGPA